MTNPGNTPLANVHVTDDPCGPVQPVPPTGPNVGDTDRDNAARSWRDLAVHLPARIKTGASTNPAGQTIVNTATATGTPRSGPVTETTSDDVDAFNPAISIVKQVNGADTATIPPGGAANYTYVVTNTGNTPLRMSSLEDTTTAPSPLAEPRSCAAPPATATRPSMSARRGTTRARDPRTT